VAVVGIVPDRLPTPAEVGIPIPGVTPAPAAAITVAAITAAAIITAADLTVAITTGVARIPVAVEGITQAGSTQEVTSLASRLESIVPSDVSPRGHFFWLRQKDELTAEKILPERRRTAPAS
jgi:hypothetical protein